MTRDDVLSIEDGRFRLDGQPFAEISFNKFDLFWHLYDQLAAGKQMDAANPLVQAQDKALRNLHELGFRSIRFFALPWGPAGTEAYADPGKRKILYAALDKALELCERHDIRMVWSLAPTFEFGHFTDTKFITGKGWVHGQEHLRELVANRNSRGRQLLYQYLDETVARYKSRKAIMMWEITNELTLQSDIDPAAEPKDRIREGQRMPTLKEIAVFYDDVARRIKAVDPLRLVNNGGSNMRECQWHMYQGKGWAQDTFEDQCKCFELLFTNSAVDVIDIHAYPSTRPGNLEYTLRGEDGKPSILDMKGYMAIAARVGKPLMIGEFGMEPAVKTNAAIWSSIPDYFESYDDAAAAKPWVEKALNQVVESGVQLAYWWCYQSDRPVDQENRQRFDICRERNPELLACFVAANKRLKEKLCKTSGFSAVTYPAGSVKKLSGMGLTVEQFIARVASSRDSDYRGNTGYDSLSVITSPYFTARVNGTDIPVYGTLAYIGRTDKGAIHSYTTIEVDAPAFPLQVQIASGSLALTNAIVLPATLGVTPTVVGGTVSATLTQTGAYTFLFNGASQEYACTLFVRRRVDEAAEIAQYRARYGAEHVIVYEPGVHEVDYINIATNNTVVYLRAGSLLVAKHTFDLHSNADEANKREPGAREMSGIGLNRFSFIHANGRDNVKVLGRGTIDFTHLDWHERKGMVFSLSNNVEIRGITLINAGEWNVTAYRVTNLQIREMTIFGHRTNSDGINVCNSKAAVVSDCFARSGDDLFSVKTLGGVPDAVCDGATFNDCVAWTGKARCFGVTWEVLRNISNVSFKNCAVIYRDATWDNNILASLAVVVGEGGAGISNVTFENIEIFRDLGRAINCSVVNPEVKGCTVRNLRFRNIRYSSLLKNRLNAGAAENSQSVIFSGVKTDDVTLNAGNVATYCEKDERSICTFERH